MKKSDPAKTSVLDPHEVMGDVALFSTCVADGGAWGLRRRGKELHGRHLPGHYLQRVDQSTYASLVRAANQAPAEWWVKKVISWTPDGDPR